MENLEVIPPVDLSQPAAPKTAKADTQVQARADKHIWGIYIMLCLISLIELYSASSREVNVHGALGVFGPLVRHVGLLVIGLGMMLYIQRVPYQKFEKPIWVLVIASIGMMFYVLFCGEIVNGARRSFSLMGITIQPSEFLKLSAALVIALIMSKNHNKHTAGVYNRGVIMSAMIVAVFGGLLIKQGLTNTLLLMAISMSMMIVGGVEWRKLIVVGVVYAALAGIFLLFGSGRESAPATIDGAPVVEATQTEGRHGTWYNRIMRHRGDGRPKYEYDITAENRQEMYAYMAQANGGVFGVMPGNSRETARLPLAFSDYIYAIVIEDTGLIGGMVVLVLYLWLLARASSIASRCQRVFSALLVIGMAVMIVCQALFHMAIVSGLAPVSGQPLPLISKGGSSIIVTSIAFGVMLSVSRHAALNGAKRQEVKAEMESLPENLRGENPTMMK